MAAQITSVGGLKGGLGKTRLAMMGALYLASRGLRVHLVDADLVSQTAADWHKAAAKAGTPLPISLSRHPFSDLNDHLDEVGVDADHVLVDLGGANRDVFDSALSRSHRLFVPIGADPSELTRLGPTVKAAKAADTPGGFAVHVVLSRTDHATTLPREARALLAGRFPVAETEMRKRVDYQRAYGTSPGRFFDVPALFDEVGIIPQPREEGAA